MLCRKCFVALQQAASEAVIGERLLNVEPVEFCGQAGRYKGLGCAVSDCGLGETDKGVLVDCNSDEGRCSGKDFGEGFGGERLLHFIGHRFRDSSECVRVQEDLRFEHAQAQSVGFSRLPQRYLGLFGIHSSGQAKKSIFAA